jgi:hypothetical protein
MEGQTEVTSRVIAVVVSDEASARRQNDPWVELARGISWATDQVDPAITGDGGQSGTLTAEIL